MAAGTRILDADDVLELEVPPGLSGYELVDGQLVPVSPASRVHGRLILVVGAALDTYVREHGLPGEVLSDAGIVLGLPRDRERMRAPDVAYVALSKLEGQDPERLVRAIPELAVEIDLTSAKKPGGQRRIVDYLEAGVRRVWAIDPHSRTALVYRPDGSARLLRGAEALDGEDVVPGFRLPLTALFG